MQKAILLLTGSPSSKNEFDRIAKETCWVWAVNPNNRLSDISKSLFWDGERTEEFQKFLHKFRTLVNEHLEFEEKYIKSMIEKFLADEDSVKVSPDSKTFSKFLLVIHGLSNSLYQVLKDEYGAFQIHVSSRSLNTNIESHDLCLYEDDDDFEQKVNGLIDSLSK
jgi:hypothetical protein